MPEMAEKNKQEKSGRSLREVMSAFAADAQERFPHLAGRLLVVDMNEYRVYGSGEKAGLATYDEAMDYLDAHPEVLAYDEKAEKPSCAFNDPDRGLHLILFNEFIDDSMAGNISTDAEKDILATLDHELAHQALPNGQYMDDTIHTKTMAESVADAYALIRHYQRFGVSANPRLYFVDPGARAQNMLSDHLHYFTSFVTGEIIARKDEIDFAALSPQQTADLAWRFAAEYAPSTATLISLSIALDPVKKALGKSAEDGIAALIGTALDLKSDYHTFKFCAAYLNAFMLDGRLSFPGLNLPQDYLGRASAALKEREFRLAQEGILFAMPASSCKKTVGPAQRAPVA